MSMMNHGAVPTRTSLKYTEYKRLLKVYSSDSGQAKNTVWKMDLWCTNLLYKFCTFWTQKKLRTAALIINFIIKKLLILKCCIYVIKFK